MKMKKAIALLVVLTMILASVPAFTVASAKIEDWSFGEENYFSGNSQVFEGADGSKTEIFENGSIRTTYPDGSKEGLDKDGNHFEESKDGTIKFQTMDGCYGTGYPDGSGVGYFPDGSSETYNADGTYSKYDAETGLTETFDKDDNWTGVYLDENNKIEFYDENGDFKNGTQSVTGKDGETITYTREMGETESGGEYMKEFSIQVTDKNGNPIAGVHRTEDENGNAIAEIKDRDGNTINATYTDDGYDLHSVGKGGEYRETETTDAAGNKTVTTSLIDNEKGHNNLTVVYDQNGDAIQYDADLKWTEDGQTTTVTTDNGNIHATVENEDGSKSDHLVTYGEDGKQSLKSVHTYKDGSKLESEIVGSEGVITGRTDTYIDKKGNEKSVEGKSFENADGSIISFDKDGIHQTDPDGGKMDFTDTGVSYSKEDGSLSWDTTYAGDVLKYYDQASGMDMYIDPETGERVFENDKTDFVMRYKEDENGNASGSIETKDGLKLVVENGALKEYIAPNGGKIVPGEEEGSWKLTRPDGKVIEYDDKGNVFTDGKQIRKDGVWAEGYGPEVISEDFPEVNLPEETTTEKPAPDTGFTGSYTGTYEYTAHWDGDKLKQGDRGYYVFEYNGCYYVIQSSDPTVYETLANQIGAEEFYHRCFDERATVEYASYDAATMTATFKENVRLNDIQHLSHIYTIVFDGKGGITISWDGQNVFQDRAEPYETGTFTGTKQ